MISSEIELIKGDFVMLAEEYSRLIKIDAMLQQNKRPTLQDFIMECRDFCPSTLSEATLNRDLKKLRTYFNRKIIYDRKNKYYRYEEKYPCLSLEDFYLGH